MSDISPYEKDQLRKKYGRNNISGHELDIYRKSKAKALNKKIGKLKKQVDDTNPAALDIREKNREY